MAQLRPRPRLGEASRQSYQVGATGATDHSPVFCFHPRLRDIQVLEPYTAECIESQATKTYTKQKRETGKVVHQHLSQPMKRRRRKKRKKKKVKHAEPRLQAESRATPRANITLVIYQGHMRLLHVVPGVVNGAFPHPRVVPALGWANLLEAAGTPEAWLSFAAHTAPRRKESVALAFWGFTLSSARKLRPALAGPRSPSRGHFASPRRGGCVFRGVCLARGSRACSCVGRLSRGRVWRWLLGPAGVAAWDAVLPRVLAFRFHDVSFPSVSGRLGCRGRLCTRWPLAALGRQ